MTLTSFVKEIIGGRSFKSLYREYVLNICPVLNHNLKRERVFIGPVPYTPDEYQNLCPRCKENLEWYEARISSLP